MIRTKIGTNLLAMIIFLTSCSEDNLPSLPSYETETSQIQSLIQSGSLLTGLSVDNGEYILYFETDTLHIKTGVIHTTEEIEKGWATRVTFNDNSMIDIPTLGKELDIKDEQFKLNPSGYAPLSGELTVSFPVKGRLKVCVKGKKGAATDLSHTFSKYGLNHHEYIHGLYMNSENIIYVSLTDSAGHERLTDSLKVTTPDFMWESKLPKFETVISKPEKMASGVTLVNHMGDNEYDTHRPFMLDAAGDIRWILWLKDHPDLKISAHTGLKRMKNGNFFCGDIKTSRFVEFDMLGNLKNSWDLRPLGYSFHHDVIELPNGHLVATASKDGSTNINGVETQYDFIIEFDPASGSVVNEWDLKESLDPIRTDVMLPSELKDAEMNWAHGNGLCYSQEDNCIIVTLRNQGICKLDWSNNLKWILSPQKGWKSPQSAYILNPLDKNDKSIIDPDTKSGLKPHPDFEYSWGGHCPVLMPNGNLLVFDNGLYRHFFEYGFYYNYKGPDPATGEDAYSRAVEYAIDEKNRNVKEIWQYGHERYRECYAGGVSSVQYLPENDHILFAPGLAAMNKNGWGGKVVEVDYKTKEVVYEVHISVPALLAFHRADRISLYP